MTQRGLPAPRDQEWQGDEPLRIGIGRWVVGDDVEVPPGHVVVVADKEPEIVEVGSNGPLPEMKEPPEAQ